MGALGLSAVWIRGGFACTSRTAWKNTQLPSVCERTQRVVVAGMSGRCERWCARLLKCERRDVRFSSISVSLRVRGRRNRDRATRAMAEMVRVRIRFVIVGM